jgi:tripartite-type tricarboxylate transporter receptor subunit TctC
LQEYTQELRQVTRYTVNKLVPAFEQGRMRSLHQHGVKQLLFGLIVAALAAAGTALAQPYPAGPITLIVPFGAGGPLDTVAGTPPDVVRALTTAAMDAMAGATVRDRLAGLGQDIPPRDQQTAAALAAYHRAEIEKWWPLIKAAKIKAE